MARNNLKEIRLLASTITIKNESEYRILGSKFIAHLFPVKKQSDFELILKDLREKYYNASHHCSAYRIGFEEITEHSSDDGEPSGTAGLPILHALQSSDLLDVGCIVVRYFGGTKLGKAGLIDAYNKSAHLVIDSSKLCSIKKVHYFELTYPYDQQSTIEKFKHRMDFKIEKAEYTEHVFELLAVAIEEVESFESFLLANDHLDIKFEKLDKGYILLN